MSPPLWIDSNLINLENDSLLFDGYLIFMFEQNYKSFPKHSGENTLIIKSFFVKSLTDINNEDKYLFYSLDNFSFYIYATQGEGLEDPWLYIEDENGNKIYYEDYIKSSEYKEYTKKRETFLNSDKFKKFKNFYEKRFVNQKSPEVFLRNLISTEIFRNVDFLIYKNSDSTGFYLFKCSFSTALLKFYASYVIGKNENGESIRKNLGMVSVLMPVSPLYYFKPVEEKGYLENGFKKAKWFPEVLK